MYIKYDHNKLCVITDNKFNNTLINDLVHPR